MQRRSPARSRTWSMGDVESVQETGKRKVAPSLPRDAEEGDADPEIDSFRDLGSGLELSGFPVRLERFVSVPAPMHERANDQNGERKKLQSRSVSVHPSSTLILILPRDASYMQAQCGQGDAG